MDQEEKKLIISVAIISSATAILASVIGGFIGGYLSLQGSYWSWDQQQDAANQQKALERQNISLALYYDISDIEERLNISMRNALLDMRNNISKLEDPNYIYYSGDYYNVNWIYDVFGKDVSGFDSITATELYIFYKQVSEINYHIQYLDQFYAKAQHPETLSPIDIAKAHTYTKGLYGIEIPESIKLAEIIKQRLREKYNVSIILTPSNKQVSTSFSMIWNRTNDSKSYDIKYH